MKVGLVKQAANIPLTRIGSLRAVYVSSPEDSRNISRLPNGKKKDSHGLYVNFPLPRYTIDELFEFSEGYVVLEDSKLSCYYRISSQGGGSWRYFSM